VGIARDLVPATDPHGKARVFISYSRKDSAFADRIEAAMKRRGFTVLIDREEILAFEEWWKRIETLVAQADTVVFVVSPDSVASKVTLNEVAFADSLNKRFAPIVCRRVDDCVVPEVLGKYNFIFFDDEARFETSTDELAEALHTDIAWVRLHTEYGEAARRWSDAKRPNGLLLRSPSLEGAENWIASRPEGVPAPTEETRTFILQSRAVATRRRSVLIASLTSGLIVAVALAGYAFYERTQVQRQLARANQALATGILADLDLKRGEHLTARQRNALWKLAAADEAVRAQFISAFSASGEEIARIGAGFREVFRSLGLQWPSPVDAEKLLSTAVVTINSPDADTMGDVSQALAAKLTEAQAQQTLGPLLQQIGKTSDPNAFQALAGAMPN
jgi:hypothetical protein